MANAKKTTPRKAKAPEPVAPEHGAPEHGAPEHGAPEHGAPGGEEPAYRVRMRAVRPIPGREIDPGHASAHRVRAGDRFVVTDRDRADALRGAEKAVDDPEEPPDGAPEGAA